MSQKSKRHTEKTNSPRPLQECPECKSFIKNGVILFASLIGEDQCTTCGRPALQRARKKREP